MMKRDMSGLVGRLVMNTIMALLYGVVFYQFDPANPQLVMGIIFEKALCLSLAQAAQIPGVMSARAVSYKQRGANFYRTVSYVMSIDRVLDVWVYQFAGEFCAVSDGFKLGEHFLLRVPLLSGVCVSECQRGQPIVKFHGRVFVLFAGFTITKDQIPDYLVWLYWINPVGWGVRALAVNQYTASDFDKCLYDGVDFCATHGMKMGEYALSTYEVPSDKFWIWYGVLYVAASYVFFLLCSFLALEYHRYESPENVVLNKLEGSGDEYTLTQTPSRSADNADVEVAVTPVEQASFISVTVAFNNLRHSVPNPTDPKKTIDLLQGISGYALPGTITALMGSSGAGKTTLMDVLAGRKTSERFSCYRSDNSSRHRILRAG
ncbi:ABC transporter G family member 38 [Phytophthora citrophthora]|uniref:ABC transporter G family member 38 n=1 Tax=Phytophthora citrophthora TaxID=4793 RepID=A0AAD9LDI2_9STRA|nr:ABC transporter G family member 38 [Phytophthora citrophthora]